MKAIKSKITRGLCVGTKVRTCDNSGGKLVRIIAVKKQKTVKGRIASAGIGDLVVVSVLTGRQDMTHQVVPAVVVRQRQEFRRPDGTRVTFEDNSVVIMKDEKGNPKGTILKGPVAKEACIRFPGISKIASIIV
jgi:large subunit ribosomal protein L14